MFDIIVYFATLTAVVTLCVVSFFVHDFGFIMHRPFDFFIELLFVSLVPSLLMVFVFARTRSIDSKSTLVMFFTVMIKLMIFHILFQLSGIYSAMFGRIV